MTDEEYQPTEEELDKIDEANEMQEEQLANLDASYPTPKEDSNLFALFWKVVKATDSTKVANLKNSEIGDLGVSVRDCQNIAALGTLFHHQKFADYWFNKGEITNATSMSRDGWLGELFVSQKKFTTRARKSSQQQQSKWKLFQKTNPQSINN